MAFGNAGPEAYAADATSRAHHARVEAGESSIRVATSWRGLSSSRIGPTRGCLRGPLGSRMKSRGHPRQYSARSRASCRSSAAMLAAINVGDFQRPAQARRLAASIGARFRGLVG